jgi:M6 family metalloprotease-like protein
MRLRGSLSKGLLIALALTLIPDAAESAQKITPGSTCKVLKQKVVYLKKTYTCTKSGNKLVWNKGVAVKRSTPTPKPTPTPTPTPTPKIESITDSPPSQPSSDVSFCKINEISSNRPRFENSLPTGFPRSTFPFATKTGTVKWALVPIDFSDIKGEPNFRSRVDDQMSLLSEWFNTVSEGKFKVEWIVADKWTTLPGRSSDYKIAFSDGPDRSPEIAEFWRKAISETDKSFDYTNVQTVNFILPLAQTVVTEGLQGFPWEQAVKNYVTQEGKISSFSIPGVFFNSLNRQYWSYWAHEFGHAMALPHIGSSREPNPFLGLDIMGNQDGYTRELTGWMRFVAGWLDNEKVYCQELQKLVSTDLTLVPLSGSKNGIKMAVIPISDSKALIVESRRETKFSCNMPTKKNGVLTYVYDATRSHGENFLIPLTPAGRSNESSSNCPVSPYPDPILRQGEKMKFEGVMIEVLESKDMDRIRISKAN